MTDMVNREILGQFARMNTAGRLAHAYVFVGPRGVGKYATALAVARQLNCLDHAPDPMVCACASCRKIAGGNHPDIFIVEKPPDKTEIVIDQIRGLIDRLEFRPIEARVKFVLIKDADEINTDAANAFLKTLEEPRPGTVLILTTVVPEALLATIRSRCQTVLFPVLSNRALAKALETQYDVPSDEAVILAGFGQGSPGRALSCRKDFLERRGAVLDAFFGPGDADAFLKVAGADRDTAREALGVLLMALRDALYVKAGATDQVVNRDRQVELKRFSERCTPEVLAGHVDRVGDAIRRINGNQNVKVVLTVVREMI